MKPFKFTVWDKQNECFSSDEFFLDKDGNLLEKYYDQNALDYYLREVDEGRYETSFSTGLFDEDREVYQGDVYEYDPNSGPPKTCSIEFINGRFVFYFINGGFFDYETEFKQHEDFDCYRYIGTKYEKPQLLEELK